MLGWPNLIDSAGLSGGSWNSSFPIANLKVRETARVARTTNAALLSTQFTVSTTNAVRLLALVNGNWSSSAKWRVTSGTFDSGMITMWRAPYTTAIRRDPVMALPDTINGTLLVEIDDTGNAAGYVQFSRVFVGTVFQPEHNASYGMTEGIEDLSTVQDLDNGATVYYSRPTRRTSQFSFDALRSNDDYLAARDMLRTQGLAGEIWFGPWPGQPDRLQADGYLARLRQLRPIEYPYYSTRKVGIEIVEIL